MITEKVIRKSGYNLHLLPTKKFKTNTFVIKMKAPLLEETVTVRALLPQVLQSNNKRFTTSNEFRSYLDELYGASFFVDSGKKGEYHTISFQLEVANEAYLSKADAINRKSIQLLSDVLFQPNVINGSFGSDTVNKEKRALKQKLNALYDDKMRYSSFRLVEEMCQDENYRFDANGIADKVDEITGAALFTYYQQALAEDEIDIYIVGSFDEAEMVSLVDDGFSLSKRSPVMIEKNVRGPVNAVREFTETQNINQGKLNIGFRSNVLYGDEDYYALQVMNGIFGGFSHSKLFINVREKASLAYYAASQIESHKGLLFVMSGIDQKNYQQALLIIKEQVEAMKAGQFTDQDIEQTKAIILNQLLETIDTSRGLVEILYHNVVAQQSIELSDWLKGIEEVTKEEIVKVANKLQMDTIYFLTGTEELN